MSTNLARDDAGASTFELAAMDVEASYGSGAVLKGLTLKIQQGETLVVVGPSGGGKSTLLRCFNLMHPIEAGEIFYRGRRIASGSRQEVDEDRLRCEVGIVFQGFNLWPNKNALQNLIEAPIHVLKMRRRDAVALAHEWLAKVGLLDMSHRYPSELSGGQQQRVAIARALMMDPRVLLLDEITSALDVESTVQILRILESLRDRRRTFVLVTHHLHFARRAADRVAVLLQGRIVEIGPAAAVLSSPQTEETRRFLSLVAEL